MKNRSILLITVLFSLMLVGIIIIQQGLLARVERLNQEAFDAAVYRSLGGVVKQVEEKENFHFIKKELEDEYSSEKKSVIKLRSKNSTEKTPHVYSNVSVHVNAETGKQTKTIIRIENDDNGNKTETNSVIIGAAIDTKDIPPPPKVPPVPETPPVPPVLVLSTEGKKEQVEVIMEKMMQIKNPDSVTISPTEIKKLLAEQLKQNDLPNTFSFCLLKKKKKDSYCDTIPEGGDGWLPYQTNLYPNDLFGRDVTLVLKFKAKDAILRSDVSWVFFLSIFFTLAVLALFIYSIRMIIKHRKLLEMKNDFINHMSHEFKTPLAGISLGADMLIDKPEKMSPEQIDKVARIIKRQSTRLDKEITDVLLSAQLEENINRIPESFNLVNTLKTQIELFQFQLENKSAKIVTRLDSENIVVKGDEMLWQKVFSNLLDNALKFSKENPEITVSVTRSNRLIRIEFSDNGIGINEKDLPHIFEKFYRSNYYKQSNIRGFGLGLNFVKKVVDSHKGTIRAESELEKGTTIIIELNA